MERTQLIENVMSELGKAVPDNIVLEKITVTKTGDRELDGVVLRDGARPSPVFYFNDIAEEYESGKPIEAIVKEIVSFLDESLRPDTDPDEIFTDKHLGIRLINISRNHRYLENIPHRDINIDIAMIMDFRASSEWVSPVNYSTYTGSDMFDTAIRNSAEILPLEIKEVSEISGLEKCIEDQYDPDDMEKREMIYVVSNDKGPFGAAALFYDGVMEMIRKMIGDYIAIPSSVHEWILMPNKGLDPILLKEILLEGNEQFLSEEEVLSDYVYIYDEKGFRVLI